MVCYDQKLNNSIKAKVVYRCSKIEIQLTNLYEKQKSQNKYNKQQPTTTTKLLSPDLDRYTSILNLANFNIM